MLAADLEKPSSLSLRCSNGILTLSEDCSRTRTSGENNPLYIPVDMVVIVTAGNCCAHNYISSYTKHEGCYGLQHLGSMFASYPLSVLFNRQRFICLLLIFTCWSPLLVLANCIAVLPISYKIFSCCLDFFLFPLLNIPYFFFTFFSSK